MKIRLIIFAVVLPLMWAGLCRASTGNNPEDSASQSRLMIHLPSEATVENENLKLGQVAEVSGSEPLAAKAREVELGRISVPGQKVTIDRSLIISRLACSEAAVSNPVFSGADKVIVSQAAKVIKGDKFTESASSFLADSIREQSIAKWEPTREPAEFVLPAGTQNFKLVSKLVSRGTNGLATIEVGVVADGKLTGVRQITLRPKYNTHRIITVADVAAKEAITAENTRIENVVSDGPEPANWAAPFGCVAVRNLPSGTVISSGMAKHIRPQVVIERNQTVSIRIERAGLFVTALGKTLQQGKLGEYIKVRNVDSQRVIMAKVNEDGTVEPVF
jgi:flagella basal body P-ring formation protein FlgA